MPFGDGIPDSFSEHTASMIDDVEYGNTSYSGNMGNVEMDQQNEDVFEMGLSEGEPFRRMEDVRVRPFGQPRPRPTNANIDLNRIYQFVKIQREIDGYGHRLIEIGDTAHAENDLEYIADHMRDIEPVVFRMKPPTDEDEPATTSKENKEERTHTIGEPPAKRTCVKVDQKNGSEADTKTDDISGKMINGIVGCMAKENSGYRKWNMVVTGPIGSVYENGQFFADIIFHSTHPKHPPCVKFNSLIFHPNITPKGMLDLRDFFEYWKPRMGVKEVYDYIFHQLNNVMTLKYRDSVVQPELAKLIAEEPKKFEELVRKSISQMNK